MKKIEEIAIGKRLIGPGHPVYLVAEIGSNHSRKKSVVKELVDRAAEAGFDAVKFQTYDPEEVFSGKIRTGDVQLKSLYGDRSWWEVARDHVLLPREWFGEMFAYARSKSLEVFSTVHSCDDAKFVLAFYPPAFKVASIDVSNTDFLKCLAAFAKPIILSTGLHHKEEIVSAVATLRKAGNDRIILLHCISNYPPRPENLNLKNIAMLNKTFGVPVGFSDHSPDNLAAATAVALGACLIEKHITLDRKSWGVDHHFALELEGMKDLVARVRQTEEMLGAYQRVLSEDELEVRELARRSVVARTDIKKGEILSRENLKLSRPGSGIHPRHLDELIGKKACGDIAAEDLVRWDDVE